MDLLFVMLLSFLTACDAIQDVVGPQLPTEARPIEQLPSAEAYMVAILDAAQAEPGEISDTLIAIRENTDQLLWKGPPEDQKVLMVTWTSWDGYVPNLGKEMELTLDVWVTAVPELQDFCGAYPSDDKVPVDRRLKQLLGLPLDSNKTKFVEMWVNPANMFRPCPDPEITDHTCEIDFPADVSAAHVAWFEMNQAENEAAFPWTKLGYTYDWGNPKSEVGFSEFVVRRASIVEIHSITPTADYCRDSTAASVGRR